MQPSGIVRTEYLRARGLEHARVTLGALSWWVHLADCSTLLVVRAGEGALRVRGERRACAAGDVRGYGPREVVSIETTEVALELSLLYLPRALETHVSDPVGDELATLARGLAERWRHSGDEVLASEVAAIVTCVSASPSRAGIPAGAREPRAVRRARIALELAFRSPPSLEELAHESGASKFHLARSFRSFHGVPPHTYLTHYRLAIARRMLIDGARGADAAVATGFADQSHFSRSFRNMLGISPHEYARLGAREVERPRRTGSEPPPE